MRHTAHPLPPCPAAAGIGVTSTGHCHPRVVEAVQQQAARVVHAQQVKGMKEGGEQGQGVGAGKRCRCAPGGPAHGVCSRTRPDLSLAATAAGQNLVGAHEAGAALLPLLRRIMPLQLDSYFLCNRWGWGWGWGKEGGGERRGWGSGWGRAACRLGAGLLPGGG
jgi:hypothetical protein